MIDENIGWTGCRKCIDKLANSCSLLVQWLFNVYLKWCCDCSQAGDVPISFENDTIGRTLVFRHFPLGLMHLTNRDECLLLMQMRQIVWNDNVLAEITMTRCRVLRYYLWTKLLTLMQSILLASYADKAYEKFIGLM